MTAPVIYGRHEGQNYISSSTTSFYRSDPDPGSVPLKAKYRVGGMCKKQGINGDHNAKARQKVKGPVNPPSKVMVMMDANRCVTRMMTRGEFASLDWGWVIE